MTRFPLALERLGGEKRGGGGRNGAGKPPPPPHLGVAALGGGCPLPIPFPTLIMAVVVPRDPLALLWWKPGLQLAPPCSSLMAVRRDKGVSHVMVPPRDIATVSKGHACTSISPSDTNPVGTRDSPCSNSIQRNCPHPCGGLDPSWLSMGMGHSRDGCWVPLTPCEMPPRATHPRQLTGRA